MTTKICIRDLPVNKNTDSIEHVFCWLTVLGLPALSVPMLSLGLQTLFLIQYVNIYLSVGVRKGTLGKKEEWPIFLEHTQKTVILLLFFLLLPIPAPLSSESSGKVHIRLRKQWKLFITRPWLPSHQVSQIWSHTFQGRGSCVTWQAKTSASSVCLFYQSPSFLNPLHLCKPQSATSQ